MIDQDQLIQRLVEIQLTPNQKDKDVLVKELVIQCLDNQDDIIAVSNCDIKGVCGICGYFVDGLPPLQRYRCHCGNCPDIKLSPELKQKVNQIMDGWLSVKDQIAPIIDSMPCVINQFSSRVCSKGTKSCVIH